MKDFISLKGTINGAGNVEGGMNGISIFKLMRNVYEIELDYEDFEDIFVDESNGSSFIAQKNKKNHKLKFKDNDNSPTAPYSE